MGRLSRPQRLKRAFQNAMFSAFNLREVIGREERAELVKAMGFDGQWDEHRRFQLAFLQEKGVESNHRFLEIGSGPLTLGIPLIEYLDKGKYVGIDVRDSVQNIAYREISKYKLSTKNPRLIVSGSFGAAELGEEQFDSIISFSVLYHLTDELVQNLFEQIARRISPSGRYWANINASVEESRWLEFPFVKRDVEFYHEIATAQGLQLKELGTLEQNGFRRAGLEKDNLLLELSKS